MHLPPGPAPVLTVCKTIPNYIPLPGVLPALKTLVDLPDFKEELIPLHMRVLVTVLFLYGCRVQELLNATVRQLIGCDRLFVKGSKHSQSYILFLPGVDLNFSSYLDEDPPPHVFPFRYQNVYRSCIRAKIRLNVIGGITFKVCHASRYRLADAVNAVDGRRSAAESLHHRGVSSVSSYLNRKVV